MFSMLLSLYSFDLAQDLSYLVERLDAIEGKVDQLLKKMSLTDSRSLAVHQPFEWIGMLFKQPLPCV